MDILITGNVHLEGTGFYKKISKDNKIVICGKCSFQEGSIPNATIYDRDLEEEEYESVFKTFHFQMVIYISKAVDGAKKVFDELESLENTLFFCKRYDVPDIIYITANDYLEGTHQNSKNSSRYILLQACEKLCYSFSQENKKNLLLLRIPYLYNVENLEFHLGQWVHAALKKKQVSFSGAPNECVDFLWDEDLANLLLKIIDEPIKNYFELNISGKNAMLFSELASLFEHQIVGLLVHYKNRGIAIAQAIKDTTARNKYGWFPLGDLKEQLQQIILVNQNKKEKKKRFQWIRSMNPKIRDGISIGLEMAVLFLAAYFLDFWVSENSLLNFVDFKLLFVVIMGTMHGLNVGIIAAIIACIAYTLNPSVLTQWQIVFYNVQNWLPYATYFLIGGISGYGSDKKKDELLFLTEEQKVLENKYVFLTEIYQKAIENNKEFSGQIIGYKDSFGRMYSVIKRLESTVPDNIFLESIHVLEDVMENKTVAIYTVEKESPFARLNVCSKYLNDSLPKSINLSNYTKMLEEMMEKGIWINTDCLKNIPDYGMPVMRNGVLGGLILLYRSTDKQMNLEYANKFSIISGLIKDSLIRATEWMELKEKETMIPYTRILKGEQFAQVIAVRKQMREKEVSEYTLLRLMCPEMDLVSLSNLVTASVRNNDVLGQGADGNIYLLLSQTGDKYISIIAQRLQKNGIEFELAAL